ncbi:unnamed protein product [Brassicogethes aeneus]|uniref:Uncharacterized protein n=1 Tax=Brassicogethes aeneus TaxID=1431903 RepID=A0A9P0AZ12_BRAAE|nr:unnamed protein product [Brassicogethes aeneus]
MNLKVRGSNRPHEITNLFQLRHQEDLRGSGKESFWSLLSTAEDILKRTSSALNILNFSRRHPEKNFFGTENPEMTSNIETNAYQEQMSFYNLSQTKMYLLLGCTVSMVIIAIIQAGCNIFKSSEKKSSNQKNSQILLPRAATGETHRAFCEFYGAYNSPSNRLIQDTMNRLCNSFTLNNNTHPLRRRTHVIAGVQRSVDDDPNVSIRHRAQQLDLLNL